MTSISNHPKYPPSNANICFKVSYLNTYFSKIDDLRTQGDWKQIILLGEQALSDPKALFPQKAEIHAELSSCAFYLGDYQLCEEHAQKCLLMAQYLADPDHLMHAQYLLSAQKRAEAGLCKDPQKQKVLFKEAHDWIYKALQYFDHSSDEYIKAKVLFNGAAAQADDPNGDINLAKHWYQEAMNRFSQMQTDDAFNRTALRLARLFLQENQPKECLATLNKIDTQTLTPKTTVHYLMIEARYLTAIEDYPKACHIILDAIEKAAQLEMKTDINRLNDLLDEIRKKDINPLEHLEFKC